MVKYTWRDYDRQLRNQPGLPNADCCGGWRYSNAGMNMAVITDYGDYGQIVMYLHLGQTSKYQLPPNKIKSRLPYLFSNQRFS